jgi:homoserine trans-succinylase
MIYVKLEQSYEMPKYELLGRLFGQYVHQVALSQRPTEEFLTESDNKPPARVTELDKQVSNKNERTSLSPEMSVQFHSHDR